MVKEVATSADPACMIYSVKFDSSLASDPSALCALDHLVLARVTDDWWYASISVELSDFSGLRALLDRHRTPSDWEVGHHHLRGILAIDAAKSDHWVEPLADCSKCFTLDHTCHQQQLVNAVKTLADLQLVREWWNFIQRLRASATTQQERECLR